MKNMNKWFWAFLGTAIGLVAAIIVAIVLGVSGGDEPDTPEIPEGPETGTYYYDAENGEYTLVLHSGNQFTLNDGAIKAGEYTVSGDTASFDFAKDNNGSATATIAGNVITFTYNDQQIRFLKKVNFTVTFNANGGEGAPSGVTVVNGKQVAKPDDPTKAGNVFVGWYKDADLTTPYVFDTAVVTADTTLYAKWVEKVVGQVEYTVDFVGADVGEMTTVGGKLYNVPTPEKDGYTFGGWWVSAYEDGEKLTYAYTEDTVLGANTTLYAVWVQTEGSKLAAPLVSVSESGFSWAAVAGASTYAVKITSPAGMVVFEDNVSATTKNFDFSVPGSYVVEVTAVATNTANNSDTTVRYYNAKALNRVSLFEVVEPSMLVFNGVGADSYYVTVVCGNASHKHVMVNNGKSTVYNFSNCDMKAGGIEFTVTAVKAGYANSVSETFTYERNLDKVSGVTVEDDTVVWNPVKGAAYYAVTVKVGDNKEYVVYVNESSYSLKTIADGAVTVKVTPVTKGYLSPEAAEYTYTKTTIAAPTGVQVVGNVISWNAVTGATGYTVLVDSKEFTVTGTTLDLSERDVSFVDGAQVIIAVKATTADKSSPYSDTVVANYNTFVGNLVYSDGVVSWSPAIGTGSYEIAVNGEVVATVTNGNSYELNFKSAGKKTISVKYLGATATDPYVIDVTVYSITFDSRLGTGVGTIYLAAGDSVVLPENTTRRGYTFTGWYNTPSASNGNGTKYNAPFYGEQDSIILYADWEANVYTITQKVDADVEGATDGATVEATYNKNYTLPIVKSDEGAFIGWFTGPGGTGIQLTDARGESLDFYSNVKDINAYPYFARSVLEFYENNDGTYSVTGGQNLGSVIDLVVPDTYNGKPVTAVLENAFANGEYSVKTVSLPNTVTLIGTGALDILYYLEKVEIREVPGNHEVVYSSYEGALIYSDKASGATYLELFPRQYRGEYTVPSTVDTIRHKAFKSANYVTKLTISKEVTYIADEAFYGMSRLEQVVFEEGGTASLAIEPTAFYSVKKLTDITLPARADNVPLATFDTCVALKNINVEEGGEHFGSIDGMLTNGAQDTILYCPVTRAGEIVVPNSVLAIGEGAFAGRVGITNVVVHNKMTEVGKNAFAGCSNLKTVVFEGGRNVDLLIGEGAFGGNTSLTGVKFEAAAAAVTDRGAVTIGAGAFKGCSIINELVFADTANIVEICANAFEGCERIPSLVIPATTTEIGDRAFSGCKGIANVSFAPNGVAITFGNFVFSGCAQLTSINLPATVTEFDGSVFEGCNNITSIVVDEANPALLAEGGVLYNKTKTEIMYFPRGKALDFGELPETLVKIGAAAFQSNRNITSVTIPAGITEIGSHAFDGCIYLTEVKFETTGAIVIGDYAFSNCLELSKVTFPEKLSAIGDYAFYQSGLGKPATVGDPFQTLVIPGTVTSIGNYAFASTMIGGVNISASVESIGEAAFYRCKNLTTVTVENGDKALAIGSAHDTVGVFEGTALNTVDLSARTTEIGVRAFCNLNSLQTVTVPAGSKLTVIGDKAFANTALSELPLPDGLLSIGQMAFRYVYNVESVTIPASVTDIGEYAFAGMWNLTSLVFADAATATTPLSINDYAFADAESLTDVTLPKRLERIYDVETVGSGFSITTFYTVFDGCISLENIFVDDNCAQFADIDGIFYIKDINGAPTTLAYCPRGKTGTVTIPSTVTLVQNLAFSGAAVNRIVFEEMENWNGEATLRIGTSMKAEYEDDTYGVFGAVSGEWGQENTDLQELVFPAHLASVGSYAVVGCEGAGVKITFNRAAGPVEFGAYAITSNSGITELLLPKVATVPDHAFTGNGALRTVSFAKGSTVDSIGYWSFTNCGVYYLYDIPASVKIIDNDAFSTSPLKEITWEEGSQLHTLGGSAFGNAQITSFVMPETLENVGSGALGKNLEVVTLNSVIKSTNTPGGGSIFYNSWGESKLKQIIVPDDNPYMEVVDGAVYSEDMSILMYVPTQVDMGGKTAFDIDDRVTVIEAQAFYAFPHDVILHEGLLEIADDAFNSAALSKVVIPSTVTRIGENAFSQMPNLTSIKFAENSQLRSAGYGAFGNNDALVELELPDGVTGLDDNMFANCTALESIDLPSSLTEIPAWMFSSCESLKEVKMYEGLQVIGQAAFEACFALESITIPASVVEFVDYYNFGIFENCRNLKNVTFAEGSKLTNMPGATFENCVSLETIVLPDKLENVAANTFTGCKNLKDVVIGGTWADLGADMFKGMTVLESLVIPNSVKTIGANAFNGCSSLKNFVLPAEIETIGESAFKGCSSLTAVTLGEKVESIGNYAFDGCSALESVVFAEKIELANLGSDPAVESAIFRGTTALKTIALPDSITAMGAKVFANSGLTSIELPAKLGAVSNYAFSGCASLTSVEIPSTVKSVGDFAFENCSELVSARLYLGTESIGTGVFTNCVSLESVNVPASINKIAGNPFINCPNLTNFDFDNNNTYYVFEEGTLMDAGKFTIIYYLPTNVTADGTYAIPETVGVIAAGAFYGSQLTGVSIPEKITEIPSMAFYNSDKLETVTLTNSIIVIGSEAFKGCTALKAFDIPEATEQIGDGAFEGCTSLERATFANRTKPIALGARLFKNCSALSAVNVPNQATGMGDEMFYNTGITEFTVPESVTSLDADRVFANSSKLVSVTMHDNVVGNLGEEFFMNCTALENVKLSAGITSFSQVEFIGFQQYTNSHYFKKYGTGSYSGAFKGCTSLESIDLSGVSHVGTHAFEGCTSLTDITFATEMYAIGDYAFAGCTSLVVVDMYDHLYGCNGSAPIVGAGYTQTDYKPMALGEYVFAGCTALEKVTLPGTSDSSYTYPNYEGIEEIKDGLFAGCTSLKFIDISNANDFAMGAMPFTDIPEDCIIFFSSPSQNAENIHGTYGSAYDDNSNDISNLDWLWSTKAMVLAADGSVLLQSSTASEAAVKQPAASTLNGAPNYSNWVLAEDGVIRSVSYGGYWDQLLTDGKVMIDEAFYYDADGSIYNPGVPGMNRDDDCLIYAKDGVIHHPEIGADGKADGVSIVHVDDPSTYTIENGVITFNNGFNPGAYDVVVVEDGDMQYVLRRGYEYGTGTYLWFTGVVADADGSVTINTYAVNGSGLNFRVVTAMTCNADGTVTLGNGAVVDNSTGDMTVTYANGAKSVRKAVVDGDVTTYEWKLVLTNGTEYTEGVVFIYDDGNVIAID